MPLVAWYPLNDNAASTAVADASGSANNGTAARNTNLTATPGKVGLAMDFDPTVPDEVAIADAPSLSFGDGTNDFPFSIAAWIKVDTLTAARGIIGKGDADREWGFWSMTDGQLRFFLYDAIGGISIQVHSTAGDIATGNAYHVGFTYDGSRSNAGMRLWKNAVDVSSTRPTPGSYVAMHDSADPVRIGRFAAAALVMDGWIDDVRIYNEELAVWRIADLFNFNRGTAKYDPSRKTFGGTNRGLQRVG